MERAGFRDLHAAFARIVAETPASGQLPERLVERACDLFEVNIGPHTQRLPPLACERGCPSCCMLRVTATAPEIIRLTDYVRRIEATPQGAATGLKRRIALPTAPRAGVARPNEWRCASRVHSSSAVCA